MEIKKMKIIAEKVNVADEITVTGGGYDKDCRDTRKIDEERLYDELFRELRNIIGDNQKWLNELDSMKQELSEQRNKKTFNKWKEKLSTAADLAGIATAIAGILQSYVI